VTLPPGARETRRVVGGDINEAFRVVLADAAGHPWLIDPSAYGGHREVDLAMLALFGSPARTIAAYEELTPLAEGWQERVGLYQLLPLLVHAALFGGSYVQSAERMAARYAG
jgi:fructosamine-3-kinase